MKITPMLSIRKKTEEATAPDHESMRHVPTGITLQSFGIAAVATILTGTFLSGLFQLRSYQPQPGSIARSSARVPVIEAQSVPTARQAISGAAISSENIVAPDTMRDQPDNFTDDTWRSNAKRWRENDRDEDDQGSKRDDERGHGKRHGWHKHKGKHGRDDD